MILSHKIALDPNNVQETYFRKAAGTARFAHNWALAAWQRQAREHQENPTVPNPSDPALRKQLNALKRTQFPWMLEVTKNAPQMAIIHLGEAYDRYFKGFAEQPVFKKKGRHDSFSLTNDQFSIRGPHVRIPKLGGVRMHEPLRVIGHVVSGTISRIADRWYLSVSVEIPDPPIVHRQNHTVCGVDLGISAMATLSPGEKIAGPKSYAAALKQLQHVQRQYSRQMEAAKTRAGLKPGQAIPKGMHIPRSANMKKTPQRLARIHARMAHIREDFLQKLTTDLVRRFDVMVIEDLHVAGMLKNHHIARAMADMGFGEFRRQLEYKATQAGVPLIVANRWFPSSKLCAACGYKMATMPLSVRTWTCPACDTLHDRDVNAAINLQHVAGSSVRGSSPVSA